MKMMEKTVRERQHWCEHCETFLEGHVEEGEWIEISYTGLVDNFDLDNYVTWTETRCGNGCELSDDDYVNFSKGDVIYVCGECNSSWPNEDYAVECCQ